MKKLITITTIIATSLIFTACGGGGGSAGTSTGSAAGSSTVTTSGGGSAGTSTGSAGGSTSSTGGSADDQQATSKVIPLNIGEPTEIQAGYSIVDSDDEAVLEILVSGETRTVILKSGMASIKMPI